MKTFDDEDNDELITINRMPVAYYGIGCAFRSNAFKKGEFIKISLFPCGCTATIKNESDFDFRLYEFFKELILSTSSFEDSNDMNSNIRAIKDIEDDLEEEKKFISSDDYYDDDDDYYDDDDDDYYDDDDDYSDEEIEF